MKLFESVAGMKLFDGRGDWQTNVAAYQAAMAHAAAGGSALHVWTPPTADWCRGPAVFWIEAKEGRPWAHLFDRDAIRLADTARRLGVRDVLIERQGEPGQHVDLCGKPLARAIGEADRSPLRKPDANGTL
jgi:hypothetical protein